MRRTIVTLIITAVLMAISGCGQMPDSTLTSSTPSNTAPPDTGAEISEPSPSITPPETVLPTRGLGEWVRHNPLPSGESVLSDTPEWFYKVWGTSSSDVFAVGTEGVIVHYDGVAWSNMDSGVNYNLLDLWGYSPHDVFAVGEKGTIIHYDGKGWNNMESGTEEILIDVGGSSSKDTFAISIKGTIFLYDGINWRTAEFNLGYDILMCDDAWGSSSSDIFITNLYLRDIGDIFHFDGIGWTMMNTGNPRMKGCIWGSSPTEIYVGGNDIVYYNGTHWITLFSDTGSWFWDIWASSPSDIFAVGVEGTIMHYDGKEWAIMYHDDSLSLRGVWGSSSEVFAVGTGGTILHYSRLSDDLIFDV